MRKIYKIPAPDIMMQKEEVETEIRRLEGLLAQIKTQLAWNSLKAGEFRPAGIFSPISSSQADMELRCQITALRSGISNLRQQLRYFQSGIFIKNRLFLSRLGELEMELRALNPEQRFIYM